MDEIILNLLVMVERELKPEDLNLNFDIILTEVPISTFVNAIRPENLLNFNNQIIFSSIVGLHHSFYHDCISTSVNIMGTVFKTKSMSMYHAP